MEDFGLSPLTSEQRQDLFEIMEDRHNVRSTIVTSQIPLAEWHDRIGAPILDRLVHGAYMIEMKGESMRKQRAKTAVPAAS
ncbi:MAG: ATP-binding protein [Leptospirales bacterium]